jgi:pimeloyl-ACP methyl ester carboxylesterase
MLLLWALKIGAIVLVICAVLLWFFQAKLIYHPRPYRADYKRLVPAHGVEIDYRTSCGKQAAFYIPPRSNDAAATVPVRLWVMFGGNGSLALFWASTVEQAPDNDAGFLLVDYPGYGKCEGSPSPASIQENSEGALDALAVHLRCSATDLERDLNVAGHSLGSASALQFAVRHPIQRAVFAAPFTTMRAMAGHVVGRGFALLLRHNYDNEKTLAEIAARTPSPRVIILHGSADPVIPVEMSRSLSKAFPRMITYQEIPGADHVSVLDSMPQYITP